jgi:hypothetical protein
MRVSEVTAISPETCFDAAYKAVMQVALLALMANGYRQDTNWPGQLVTRVLGLPQLRLRHRYRCISLLSRVSRVINLG